MERPARRVPHLGPGANSRRDRRRPEPPPDGPGAGAGRYWPMRQIDANGSTPTWPAIVRGTSRGRRLCRTTPWPSPCRHRRAGTDCLGRPTGGLRAGNGRPSGAVAPTDSVLVTILQFNEGRKRRLVRLKLRRMARDPFAFFRGTDHLFAAAWPDLRPPDAGPEFRSAATSTSKTSALPFGRWRAPLRHQRLRRGDRRSLQPRPRPLRNEHPARRRALAAHAAAGLGHGARVPGHVPPDGHRHG